MERLVIGAALLTAGVFVAASFWGGDAFHFRIDDDDDFVGGSVSDGAQGDPIAATPYPATALRITDAAAIVTVIPEERGDIAISVTGGERLPALRARLDGSRLILDGGLDRRLRHCGSAGRVTISGLGELGAADLPKITVRTPRAVDVDFGGAVSGEIGPSTAAEIETSGCGDLRIGDVAGRLEVSSSGSGALAAGAANEARLELSGASDLTMGAIAGEADVELAGSGDVVLGAVGGGLSIDLAGSGGVTAAAASGALSIDIAGSGDVTIGGGRPAEVEVSIAGSGGVDIAGPVGALDASIVGSGDVSVGKVEGRFKSNVMGSGAVRTRE